MNGKKFKPLIDDDDHDEVLEPIITKKVKLVEYDSDWFFYIIYKLIFRIRVINAN